MARVSGAHLRIDDEGTTLCGKTGKRVVTSKPEMVGCERCEQIHRLQRVKEMMEAAFNRIKPEHNPEVTIRNDEGFDPSLNLECVAVEWCVEDQEYQIFRVFDIPATRESPPDADYVDEGATRSPLSAAAKAVGLYFEVFAEQVIEDDEMEKLIPPMDDES